MRLCATDPGFDWSKTYKVTVDGVDVTNRCFAADEEAGTAECFPDSWLNNPDQLSPEEWYAANGLPVSAELPKETVVGKVVITITDKAEAPCP